MIRERAMEQNNTLGFTILMIISAVLLLQLPSSLADPTDSFTIQNYTYVIQWPYDKSVNQRYSFINGVHTMWVFDNDKPHTPTSKTKPRTEMGLATKEKRGKYESGVWQLEGEMYVPSGTTGVAVMQVMGSSNGVSAALQIRVYDGELLQYGCTGPRKFGPSNVYNHWIHVIVIHDADNKQIQVYLDGKLSLDLPNPATGVHSFKCGVSAQNSASHRMEFRWKNIKVWKRSLFKSDRN